MALSGTAPPTAPATSPPTTRSVDPPAVTSLIVDLDVIADTEPARVHRMVEQALRYGTITRTIAR